MEEEDNKQNKNDEEEKNRHTQPDNIDKPTTINTQNTQKYHRQHHTQHTTSHTHTQPVVLLATAQAQAHRAVAPVAGSTSLVQPPLHQRSLVFVLPVEGAQLIWTNTGTATRETTRTSSRNP